MIMEYGLVLVKGTQKKCAFFERWLKYYLNLGQKSCLSANQIYEYEFLLNYQKDGKGVPSKEYFKEEENREKNKKKRKEKKELIFDGVFPVCYVVRL
eukprot:TRINITY_DN487_c1_g1_i1.p1 TRINITY_DN487_c1_g1~~TRINITY_DN487_c1_g1_i1.p1  ORF type:complete len:108 (+),score=6.70 TRINITY_DN487_c1_g1_i1:36-326(+)